jgi:hypothetical protein
MDADENPKAEIRSPKEIRNPKLEATQFRTSQFVLVWCSIFPSLAPSDGERSPRNNLRIEPLNHGGTGIDCQK